MEQRPMEDHPYVFTIVGRCNRCQRPESAHVALLPSPDPLTECPADHNSITAKALIGDAGWSWSRCPYCNVMVEPMMRSEENSLGPTGPVWGPGRGDMTARLKRRLEGWLGWLDSPHNITGGGR